MTEHEPAEILPAGHINLMDLKKVARRTRGLQAYIVRRTAENWSEERRSSFALALALAVKK